MAKKDNIPLPLIIAGIVAVVIWKILLAISTAIQTIIVPLFNSLIAILILFILYEIYKIYYFKSASFRSIKGTIQKNIDECNNLNFHIEELKNSYINVVSENKGVGDLIDSNVYNFKRTEWKNSIKNNQVYNCSSVICKGANNQPFKYLCKYFNIEITESSLEKFEQILNNFSAAEQGKILLKNEKESIIQGIGNSVPWIIFKFNKDLLFSKLGFRQIDFSDLYFPIYTFQYVSAGGYSSMKYEIKLDIENLEKFVGYLNGLVKFRKSVDGQRALMTTGLRERIKIRDQFSCQKCRNSIYIEQNLLLEIDHIIPLSKGGITSESNLQTLCWKCNRKKGAKLEF